MPYPQPIPFVRYWEINDNVKTAKECFVHVAREIDREYSHPVALLHPLEQVSNLDVGVTVVRVPDLPTFAEECIGFIEKKSTTPAARA